jgi:Chitobiase/beta-hexosaminidase C-terminal domain
MIYNIYLGQGDSKEVDVVLTDRNGVVDLSTAAIVFDMKNDLETTVHEIICTGGNNQGQCTIPFTEAHTEVYGIFYGQFIVTVNNVRYTFPDSGYLRIQILEGIAYKPQTEIPTISPLNVTIHAPTQVTITGEADATLYYTTDGSGPTINSSVYTAPFTLSDSATVKAMALKADHRTSLIASSAITMVTWPTVETPVLPGGSSFVSTKIIQITCATAGAAIYYTLNGSTPNPQTGVLYVGSFTLSNTATVKAIAVKENNNDSAIAQATYTKL